MVDSHCHLDFPDYQGDFAAVLKRTQAQLEFVVNVGTDIKTSERAADLGARYPFIYSAIGVHPHDASTVTPATLAKLATLASVERVVAIGECGFDYARLQSGEAEAEKQQQRLAFAAQIELARAKQLPLIVHCREAYADLLNSLQSGAGEWRGVIHCYLGDVQTARELMDLGFYISFTGIITFKNASPTLIETVKHVPLEKMLLETDAPFLAPTPYRGKRNEPAYVWEVAKKVAEIKGISVDEVDRVTSRNARTLFGIF